ncbi:unnamed protein product [Rotaria sordida]|uniref:Uncharacterized protein n=1 Tax=Rotaria sordida TaxID=392033 RepID=A0A815QEH0_9BILA|nr:unnamed protein product [Rotaria sordida]
MTVVVQTRDRSICCQKSYDLFKNIERQKIPLNKLNPYQIKIRNQTVCFRDLIIRYLHTQIHQTRNFSNFICHNCSMILLDIEQCAKYLPTYQKKRQQQTTIIKEEEEQLPIINSDSDEEFDDIDDEEEFDDEQDDIKPNVSTNIKSSNQSKSLHFTPSSLSSSSGSNSSSSISTSKINSTNKNTNNGQCNDNNNNVDDGEDDDEIGLIKNSSSEKFQQKNLHLQTNPLNILSGSNGLITTGNTMNLLEETNPNLFQLRLAHIMASMASINTGQNRNDNNPNVDTMMNTLANMQRNFLLQFFNDPTVATQAAARAAAVAVATSAAAIPMKVNLTQIPLITSNNKQIGSCRKRKSTLEKRVLTNHRSSKNNDDTSPPTIEHESLDNNNNTNDLIDHPLELTFKNIQQSNPILSSPAKSSTDIYNIVV